MDQSSRELEPPLGAGEAVRQSQSVAAYSSSDEVECKIAPLVIMGCFSLKYVRKI